ncbi:hypothetical protein OI18_03455 [Flavihumibacter solisilvae]|uniref:Uncharacterized protein n=1 Tax=Flavihumibacter solisilvae TaxID=1349421 RepID=A0A0C1IZK5_9BACT|nr:hypothetical protein OI18_03455 [Flavihumibacter solisilvae]
MFKLITRLAQFASTTCILLFIYMVYAFADMTEFDLITELSFIIIQPIIGLILTFLTTSCCYLIGLPLRLNQKVKTWWLERQFIPAFGLIAGIVLILLSFYSQFTHLEIVTLDSGTVEKRVPNFTLAIIGWFTIAFALLHFYPFHFFKYSKKALK